MSVKKLLEKDEPELERIFNGGALPYTEKCFDDFSKRLPYLEKGLGRNM